MWTRKAWWPIWRNSHGPNHNFSAKFTTWIAIHSSTRQPASLCNLKRKILSRKWMFWIPEDKQPNPRSTSPRTIPLPNTRSLSRLSWLESTRFPIYFSFLLFLSIQIQLFARDSQDPYASILPVDFASIHAIPAPEIVGLGQIAVMGVHRRFQIGNVSDYQKLDVSAVDPEGKEILLDSSSERDENTVTCCYTPKVFGKVC